MFEETLAKIIHSFCCLQMRERDRDRERAREGERERERERERAGGVEEREVTLVSEGIRIHVTFM